MATTLIMGQEKCSDLVLTSPIYELMVARETGEWDVVAKRAKTLNLSLPFVNRAFNEAVSWAHQMTSAPEDDCASPT